MVSHTAKAMRWQQFFFQNQTHPQMSNGNKTFMTFHEILISLKWFPYYTHRKINMEPTKSPVWKGTSSSKPPSLSSWWFQPIWKMLVKLGIFPKLGSKINSIWNHHLARKPSINPNNPLSRVKSTWKKTHLKFMEIVFLYHPQYLFHITRRAVIKPPKLKGARFGADRYAWR